jgi:hypothetical protein
MKFLDDDIGMRDADSGDEVGISTQQIEQELAQAQQELMALPAGYQPVQKAAVQNRIAELLVDLQRGEEAFDIAREAFDTFVAAEQWEDAVQSCTVMFLADPGPVHQPHAGHCSAPPGRREQAGAIRLLDGKTGVKRPGQISAASAQCGGCAGAGRLVDRS